jgi:aldose 1-epimerase
VPPPAPRSSSADDGDHYTPTDCDLIPTGAIVSVTDTPFDFRGLRPIADVDIPYDRNFVLHRAQAGLRRGARLLPRGGGSAMEVYTTEPGLQFYDGTYLTASHPGLDGRPHFARAGLRLEPGRFPDGPNHPHFPSPVLRPGDVYRQTTQYRFVNTDSCASENEAAPANEPRADKRIGLHLSGPRTVHGTDVRSPR